MKGDVTGKEARFIVIEGFAWQLLESPPALRRFKR